MKAVLSSTHGQISSAQLGLQVQGVAERNESLSSVSSPSNFKIARLHSLSPGTVEPKRCHDYLSRIPMELLAEILLYSSSTQSVLAFARCSKYFCATLLNKSSVFIWRNVRAACKPYAIPDPPQNFTEPAYAAFIFDGGECEVCKATTSVMYMSFALRVRLCGRSECLARFTREQLTSAHTLPSRLSTMPSAESDTCFRPDIIQRYRKADVTQIETEYLQAKSAGRLEAIEKSHKFEMDRLPMMMEWAVDLFTWKQKRHVSRREVKRKNVALARTITAAEGWSISDLLSSQTYGALHHSRTKELDEVRMSEYELIHPKVDAEITKILEARERSTTEGAYRRRRDDVEQHYDWLKSAGKGEVFPNLAQFRQLPIINFLQKKSSTTTGIAGDLNNSELVKELLEDDLRKWRESASTALAATLGFTNWRSANKKHLHPVERLTARFRCKKCKCEGHKFYMEENLDFAGACAHVCLRPDMNKRAREKWTPNQFEKDNKAIDAICKVLALCGINAEDSGSFRAVEELGSRIRCLSCESKVVMTFRHMITHAQRHENVQIFLLSAEEAASLPPNHFEFGACSKLLGPKLQARKLLTMNNYSCQHCFHTDCHTATLVTTGGTQQLDNWRTVYGRRLYNFNGLRSHLKAKHGIQRICDEDVFCEEPLVWT